MRCRALTARLAPPPSFQPVRFVDTPYGEMPYILQGSPLTTVMVTFPDVGQTRTSLLPALPALPLFQRLPPPALDFISLLCLQSQEQVLSALPSAPQHRCTWPLSLACPPPLLSSPPSLARPPTCRRVWRCAALVHAKEPRLHAWPQTALPRPNLLLCSPSSTPSPDPAPPLSGRLLRPVLRPARGKAHA